MSFEKTVYVLDESLFGDKLVAALAQDKAVFHDGVAYWAKGSGGQGVIQHLPFKELPLEQVQSVSQAVKTLQNTTLITTAVSTTVIVGVIIAQTQYLAAKIEDVRKAVDQVSSKVDEQNLIFYIDRFSSYLGHLETCRTLLSDRNMASEIEDLAVGFLPEFMSARNYVLSLVQGVSRFLEERSVSSENTKALLGFSLACLDMVPKGIHMEYLLSARIGKVALAEQILIEGEKKHTAAKEAFRRNLNLIAKNVVAGNAGREQSLLLNEFGLSAKALFDSEDNALLLMPPTRKVEMPSLRLVA